MCVMEVRAGQHSSTIAQACAHNVSTLERDLDMFKALLNARAHRNVEEKTVLDGVVHAQAHLAKAYAALLEVFGEEVGREVEAWDGEMPNEHGNERTLVEEAKHDADLARKFETR